MVSISLCIFKGQKINCNPNSHAIYLISLNFVAVTMYDTDLLTAVVVNGSSLLQLAFLTF